MNPVLFKFLYYFLSFTWGIIANIAGAFISIAMLATGHRPRRFGGSVYFECRGDFGGFSYGIFFVKGRGTDDSIRYHEYGHSIQNCMFGPFMIIAVALPSTIRYWYRRVMQKKGRMLKTAYDDIWFEGHATALGRRAFRKYYQ